MGKNAVRLPICPSRQRRLTSCWMSTASSINNVPLSTPHGYQPPPASVLPSPLDALRAGTWFKLICGASYHHIPDIRNLALAYTIAGADCIDTAADPAVLRAAQEGIDVGMALAPQRAYRPWLMASVNNGEDPHFRKAAFDPQRCPPTCHRPCERICPTQAIAVADRWNGVHPDLCYGCGRCVPVCPFSHIETHDRPVRLEELAAAPLDALEIHTLPDRLAGFRALWQQIEFLRDRLHLIAVSFPDGDRLQECLTALLAAMTPPPAALIWQTDGRPMSGDIGRGTTHAAIALATKVLAMDLPYGYVQLAGGTNGTTAAKVRRAGIRPAGVAYGSYARRLLADLLPGGGDRLEDRPELLAQAVARARGLVEQIKSGSSNDWNDERGTIKQESTKKDAVNRSKRELN